MVMTFIDSRICYCGPCLRGYMDDSRRVTVTTRGTWSIRLNPRMPCSGVFALLRNARIRLSLSLSNIFARLVAMSISLVIVLLIRNVWRGRECTVSFVIFVVVMILAVRMKMGQAVST